MKDRQGRGLFDDVEDGIEAKGFFIGAATGGGESQQLAGVELSALDDALCLLQLRFHGSCV